MSEEVWNNRAKKYQQLNWTKDDKFLDAFFKIGKFNTNDIVLDLGTGTGIIAHTIAPFVDKVIGIDYSEQMLLKAIKKKQRNESFIPLKVEEINVFNQKSFTKITARMIFHHILKDLDKVVKDCYKLLRPGGSIIIAEGIPPSVHAKEFYTEMFKFKEERRTFMEEDLKELLKNGGFENIQTEIFGIEDSSIKNWLKNSGLPKETQDYIFNLHLNMDDQCKKDYNFYEKNNDCFIDMKFVIIKGFKPRTIFGDFRVIPFDNGTSSTGKWFLNF